MRVIRFVGFSTGLVEQSQHEEKRAMVEGRIGTFALAAALLMAIPAIAQEGPFFTPGNLVVTVQGCGVYAGTCTNIPNGTGNGTGNSSVGGYGDNQAAPLTLFQYVPNGTSSATFLNSLVLQPTSSAGTLTSPVSTALRRRAHCNFQELANTLQSWDME
jgi:hypothetical protein